MTSSMRLRLWASRSPGSPSPGAGATRTPPMASTASASASPPTRRICPAMTCSFHRRWAGGATWESSPPPTPDGPAWGHTGLTRSALASRISMASAQARVLRTLVTRARTRSPGRVWRTNTTRPEASRATQAPPWAGSPIRSSRTSPTPSRAALALARRWGEGRRRARVGMIGPSGCGDGRVPCYRPRTPGAPRAALLPSAAGASAGAPRPRCQSRWKGSLMARRPSTASSSPSFHGTMVMTTPGTFSRERRRRSALWLWTKFSQKWLTRNCGM